MFESQITVFPAEKVTRLALHSSGRALSYAEVIGYWQTSEDFRTFFIQSLADSPYLAFRWETPAVTSASSDRAFEFVLLDYPRLQRKYDATTFAEYFNDTNVVTFPNLRGDAPLVVPCPRGDVPDYSIYSHLAAFVRNAPTDQVHALWQAVGKVMEDRLGDLRQSTRPVWLSTAGMGVAWLHVRLDSQPKYYGFLPYKKYP